MKIKRSILFLIGYLLLFTQFWTKDLIQINEYIFYIPAFICILLSISLKGIDKRRIFIILSLNFLGILVYIFSKSMTVLKITIILSAIDNREIDKIIKYSFWTGILILILHIFCTVVLKMGTLYVEGDFGRNVIEKRYYLGFPHANSLQLFINILIITWSYTYLMKIKNTSKKIISIIMVLLLIGFSYMLTKSRTGVIIGVVTVFLAIMYSSDKNKIFDFWKNYKVLTVIYIMIIVFVLVSIFFMKNTKIYSFLNKAFTGRWQMATRVVENYDLNLFGQELSLTFSTSYNYDTTIVLDQGIINPLLSYGIIVNVLFYFSQIKLLKKYCLEKKYNRVMIIMLMIIYSITENALCYSFTNMGILFIADLIYNRSNYNE